MRTTFALLAMAISVALASTAFAGVIKPLHTCASGTFSFPSPNTSSTHTADCPAGTTYFEAQVRDRAPNNASTVLNIQVIKSPTNGPVRADATDGDGSTSLCTLTGFSGYSRVSGGSGTYTVQITKTGGTDSEDYDVSHHCIKVESNGTLTDMNGSLSTPPVQQ
ncbi:MAG: hypothetical protein Q7U57_03860 [Methylovulum sp.]|nr:hypothetical protein [Methylovulum sp.]